MVNDYILTVGLEIHAELKTQTKMFCDSKNDPDEARPNVNVCPICMAHPGTLPVINREAVRHVLRVGAALGGTQAEYTEFDRKSYFYPDLPKGYQISQFEHPLVSGGVLNGIAVTRVHLEEDTARSQHAQNTGKTLVDYNRAGVPLMELVTEPVIHSAEIAANFAKELQLVLRYLGAGEANMEKGEMRVEANISVAPEGQLGTKVEVKNLNSFRSMERAIDYEYRRQSKLLADGGVVRQETLGWDEAAQKTYPQRIKEGSADYRYFPDPDLPKLVTSQCVGFSKDEIAQGLPALPQERRNRYLELGITADDAELYVREPFFGDFYDSVIAVGGWTMPEQFKLASNYVATDIVKLCRDYEKTETKTTENLSVSPQNFALLVDMLCKKEVSSRGAKDILAIMFRDGGSPTLIAERENLYQRGETDDLLPVVRKILADNSAVAESVRSGKQEAVQFLVGQGMKATKGSADPIALRELILKEVQK